MSRVIVAMATLLIVTLGNTSASAQDWRPPTDAERCPSRRGTGDERGVANLMTPKVILRAARLITTGEVIEMAYPLFDGMPFYGSRVYNQQLKRTNWPPGTNTRGSNEEIITTELGQVGTQIDGFGHQSIGNSLYNCFKIDEVTTRTGFSRLGIENAGSLFTRGVLIDVAALRGVEMLGDRDEITAQDLQDALTRQNLTIEPGDAVIINAGFGRLWGEDNVRYFQSQPGLGVGVAEWLAGQNPMIFGSDTCCVEVNPNPVFFTSTWSRTKPTASASPRDPRSLLSRPGRQPRRQARFTSGRTLRRRSSRKSSDSPGFRTRQIRLATATT